MKLQSQLIQNLLAFFMLQILLGSITGCSLGEGKPLVLNGTIEADDILVGSKIGGRVTEVLVKEGDKVKAGEVLVRLDDAELKSRREQALAGIKQAEERVKEREAYLKLVVTGNRQQEIERARAQWESVKAKLDLAIKDKERYESLYERGVVSRQQRDNAVNQVAVLKEEAASAKEKYDLMKSGFRDEEIAQAQADLTQAKAALEQSLSALEEVETQLKEMTIRAPMDALVEVCDLFPGDLLGANQTAVTLILPDRLWVRVYVPENYLGYMKENAKVEVRVDSFPKETFHGYVEQINRKAEFTPRNIQSVEERVNLVFGVKVRLDNSLGRLRAGMSADVTFPDVRKM
ncbi:MAG TPA: efflux RND transporter periplasmic adaptor subunit [Thermodesulfobacteriota bacterium]|nr:efflux RND transporter periplasmic adaptor subunit [Thermodesulfobacteriota bacterium]